MVNAAFQSQGGKGETEVTILRNRMPPRGLPTYVAAIDPGQNTGVAVMNYATDEIIWWGTKSFFTVQDFLLNTFKHRQDVKVIVEVPPGFLYERNEAEESEDETPGVGRKIRDRKMLNIGGVKRESELLAEALRRLGFSVTEVSPVRQKKWTPAKFQLVTKSHKRANKHEMDAVRLAIHYKNK